MRQNEKKIFIDSQEFIFIENGSCFDCSFFKSSGFDERCLKVKCAPYQRSDQKSGNFKLKKI